MVFAVAPFIPALVSGGASAATTAAAIGAGASLLGGAISARNARGINASNAALSREFAQHGIRWRVADAKAAGLHPLSVLGSNSPSYYPSQAVGDMGQAVSQAGQQVAQGVLAKAQLRVMNAQANYYDALAFRALAPMSQAPEQVGGIATQEEGTETTKSGQIRVKPDEVTSASKANPGMTAGIHPFWQRANIGPFQVLHPRTDEPGDMDFLGWIAAVVGTFAWKVGKGYEWIIQKAPSENEIRQVYRELRRKFPALLSQIEGQIRRERDKGPSIKKVRPGDDVTNLMKGLP